MARKKHGSSTVYNVKKINSGIDTSGSLLRAKRSHKTVKTHVPPRLSIPLLSISSKT
jgi:hypothetical protein